MSGIFDALFTALGKPDGERGPLNPKSTQPSRRNSQVNKQPTGQPTGSSTEREARSQSPPSPSQQVGNKVPTGASPTLTAVADDAQPAAATARPDVTHPEVDADASSSTLADLSTETASTLADIQIGPQPTPFVYHRRSQTHSQNVGTIGDITVRNQRYRQMSSPGLTVSPTAQVLPASDPTPPAATATESQGMAETVFCAWRRDQIESMKPARLVNEGKVKTLSSLHGPLTLPYARNPSGVDATVPDNSAYYANTFGLRAIPKYDHTDRNVSGGTTGTRSSSGSSMAFLPNRPKHSSDSEHGQHSVMMVRDPYQRSGSRTSDDRTDRSRQHKAEPEGNHKSMELTARSMLNPSSSPFNQKQYSRRALGVTPLSPILDAPDESHTVDSLKMLVEAALAPVLSEDGQLASQYDEATLARLLSTARFYGIDPRKVSTSSSNASRIPSLETSSSMSSALSKMPQTPQQVSQMAQASKADNSANWRAKNKRDATPEHDTPSKGSSGTNASPAGPVMTIDELMAKFNSPSSKGDEKVIKFKAPSPVDPAMIKEDEPPKPNKAKSATGSKTKPLGEMAMNVSPATSPKPTPRPTPKAAEGKKQAMLKGTPGAGKLLRKQSASPSSSAATAVPMPASSTKSKSTAKLAAIAERSVEGGTLAE